MPETPAARLFINEHGGVEAVVLVLEHAAIVESEGELVPAIALDKRGALKLAAALLLFADEL